MSAPLLDPRHIIPNWRTFRMTAAIGELDGSSSTQKLPDLEPTRELLEEKKRELKVHPVLSSANDLLATAMSVEDSEAVELATMFIQAQTGAEAAFSKSVLARLSKNQRTNLLHPELALPPNDNGRKQRIHDLRTRLHADPRNAIAYVDIARCYSILGQVDQARECIRRALLLAGDNRFVLRAAARFYIHIEELDRAFSLIANAPPLSKDPWLLATEIAVASVIAKRSRNIKAGREMLVSGNFEPRHLSELAAALASEELQSGKDRKADKLFSHIIAYPTENSLAQLCSFPHLRFKNEATVLIQKRIHMVPCTYEANANILMDTSEWEKSFEEAQRWFWDQPFSSRPVIFASYLASNVLGLPEKAVEMIDQSLVSNPCDEMLLNNRAFALAQLNRIEDARKAIADGRKCSHDEKASAPLTATEGMIEMRAGNLERGQELYRAAIGIATKAKNQIHKEVAEMHFAIELAMAGLPSPELGKLLGEGAKSSQKLVRASALGLQKWAEKLFGKSPGVPLTGFVVGTGTAGGLGNRA